MKKFKTLFVVVFVLIFATVLFGKDKTPGEMALEKFQKLFKGRGIKTELITEKKVNIPGLKGYNFVIIKLSKGKRSQSLPFFTNGKYMIREMEEIGTRRNLVSYYQSIYTTVNVPFSDNELLYGKKGAKIKIVYFGDFQCPFCKRCLNFILNNYKDNIAIYLKHFPLPFHKNAIILAKIYEAGKKLNLNLLDFVEHVSGDKKSIMKKVKTKVPKKEWKKFEKLLKSKEIEDKIKSG